MSAFPAQPTPATGSTSDWRDIIPVLLERKWIGITVFALCVILTAIWTWQQTPLYSARAVFQVDTSTEKVLNIAEVAPMGELAYTYDQYLNTQLKAIRSRTFAEKVLRDSGLLENARFTASIPPGADPAHALLSAVRVAREGETRLINVIAEHTDPEVAAIMANGFAAAFVRQNLDRRMQSSLEAVEWLRAQADDSKRKLDASEAALMDYSSRNGRVSPESETMAAERMKTLSDELTRAEAARFDAETQWTKIRDLNVTNADLDVISLVAAGLNDSPARTQILEKQAEITLLSQRYKAAHPSMQKSWGELRAACRDARSQIEAAFLVAKAKEDRLREAIRKQEADTAEISRKLVEYSQLKRVTDADRQLYESIMTRMKEAGITGKLETNNMRVIDRAVVPGAPFKPNRLMNLLKAVGGGLCLAVIFCFGAHAIDDRVKRIEDVITDLHVSALGFVPHVARSIRRKSPVVHEVPDAPPAEAFRMLRAALTLGTRTRNARCLLITSVEPAEGKTLVASNLAAALAMNRSRVLLIDADMRRPAVHRVLRPLQEREGLAGILASGLPWKSVVCDTAIDGLHVIPAGAMPPNPAELLGMPALGTMLREAADLYDYVLLDSPPAGGLSDALVLVPNIDAVLVVVRFRQTHRRALAHAVEKLRAAGASIGGFVLNDADTSRFGGYYGYYHRYHGYRYRDYRHPAKRASVAAQGAPPASGAAPEDEALRRLVPPAIRPMPASELPSGGAGGSTRAQLSGLTSRLEEAWQARSIDSIRRLSEDAQTANAPVWLAHCIRAVVRHLQGNTGAAFAAVEDAIRTDAHCVPALELRVRLLLGARELERAAAAANVLRGIDPDNPVAAQTAAYLHLKTGQLAEAERLLRHSLSVRIDTCVLNDLAVVLLARGDTQEACDLCLRALDIAPGFAECWDTLGQARLAAGDAQEAEKALRRALELNSAAAVRVHLADALLARGKSADAIDMVRSIPAATGLSGADAAALDRVKHALGLA